MFIQVDLMLSEHAWILEEKKYFGQQNTTYDFKSSDPKEAGRRIQKLQETKDKLSKSVNMRAMNMLGKAEEQVSVYLHIFYCWLGFLDELRS
jgi:structural maintenance of chromosome 2